MVRLVGTVAVVACMAEGCGHHMATTAAIAIEDSRNWGSRRGTVVALMLEGATPGWFWYRLKCVSVCLSFLKM
jgi:hypothetical protein